VSALSARLHLLGVALAVLSGCLVSPADFFTEKSAIEANTGLSLVPTTSMRVGALAFGLARASMPESEALLEHLDRVEVATFEVRGGSSRRAVAGFHAEPGWTCLVHARQRDGAARIFLEERSGGVARLFIVAASGEALMLVRLEGSLDGLLAEALNPQAAARWVSGAEK
jgi:hypothetical protein